MTPRTYTACFLLLLLPIAHASKHVVGSGCSQDSGYVYDFEPDQRDYWDPRLQKEPPLSSAAAITAASAYAKDVPVPFGYGAWRSQGATLKKYSPITWYYRVLFQAGPLSGNGFGNSCSVAVRMDGSIAVPNRPWSEDDE